MASYGIPALFLGYYFVVLGVQASTLTPSSPCNDLNHCRTTWTIVWSCLPTIFTCTWVAIHPNISGPNEKWLTITLRRLRLMLIALLAPEFIIWFAMRQRIAAHKLKEDNRAHGWTLSHGFFAIMGGFALVQDGQISCTLQVIAADDPGAPTVQNYIHQINITEEEIKDKSKGDLLSKGLVIIQTSWFIIQCIARRAARIPITELEIVTAAFIVLNFVIYSLWWNKPLGVQCPVRVVAKLEEGTETKQGNSVDIAQTQGDVNIDATLVTGAVIRERNEKWELTSDPGNPVHWLLAKISGWDGTAWKAKRVPTFYVGDLTYGEEDSEWDGLASLIILVIATIFGVIHCLAWSFQFPSHTEQLLWRISSLVITCVPVLCLVGLGITAVADLMERYSPRWSATIAATCGGIIVIGVIVYPVARLSLLVLAFVSLRSLSPGAFETIPWTRFIPHI